jgi:endonuclease I
MFLDLDNESGHIECVYTGEEKDNVSHMPNPSDMNCEHTWPQSHGATGIAKSDLHHLYITDSRANSCRGNLPFGYVEHPDWEEGGSCRGDGKFQVRPCHRGNVARAIFYFAVRYDRMVDPEEEQALREWHAQDPVDEEERQRNEGIFAIQRNRNPFVDHPEFVSRISNF